MYTTKSLQCVLMYLHLYSYQQQTHGSSELCLIRLPKAARSLRCRNPRICMQLGDGQCCHRSTVGRAEVPNDIYTLKCWGWKLNVIINCKPTPAVLIHSQYEAAVLRYGQTCSLDFSFGTPIIVGVNWFSLFTAGRGRCKWGADFGNLWSIHLTLI